MISTETSWVYVAAGGHDGRSGWIVICRLSGCKNFVCQETVLNTFVNFKPTGTFRTEDLGAYVTARATYDSSRCGFGI